MSGRSVDIVAPDGSRGTVDEAQLQQALEAGARIPTADDRDEEAADTFQGKAAAFATGADEATMGLGTELGLAAREKLYGAEDAAQVAKDIRGYREKNSGYATAGGLVGGLVTGPAGLELGAESALGRIGATALEGAYQGAYSGAGHALTEQALGNPDSNAESYFAEEVAKGFALGGVTGAGLGGLGEGVRRGLGGVRSNSRVLGEVGQELTGDAKAGRELIEGYRGAEGAVDEIMGSGKYTLGEARKVVADADRIGQQSALDSGMGKVFDEYMTKVASDDPSLANVMRTQYERGAQLASKSESEIDGLARGLAERGDKVLGVEEKLYEQSIEAKGQKMAKLVDPSKRLEAIDTGVGMIRNVRSLAEQVENLQGGKGLARALREEAERTEQAISGRAAQPGKLEGAASAKLEAAQGKLTEAEQRVAAAEERVSAAAKEGPGSDPGHLRELERARKAQDAAREQIEKLQSVAAEAAKGATPAREATAGGASSVFMELDNLKRNVGRLKGMAKGPTVEGYVQKAFEQTYETALRAPLENEAVWGAAAAAAQREVNEAWTSRLATRDNLGSSFLSDFGKDFSGTLERADAGKFKGYLKNISGPENDLKRQALAQWLDGTEHAMNATERHYGTIPDYGEGRKVIKEMRDMLGTAEKKAQTLEALQTQKLAEGDGLGGALGLVSDVFVRPLKTAERLAAVKSAVNRVEAGTKRVVSSLFEGKAGAVAERVADRETVKESAEAVRKMAASPEGFMASLSKRLDGLSQAAPEHARALTVVASRALSHLAQYAPAGRKDFSALRTEGKARYTDSELDTFARRLRVVEDPLSVVRDAERGKLTVEQMQTLREVYPSIYNGIREKAWGEIERLKKSGKIDSMPYSKRLSVGILLDLPSDLTMEPDFISIIQSSKAKPQQQAPQGGSQQAKKPQQDGGVKRRVEIDRSALQTESARLEGGTQ